MCGIIFFIITITLSGLTLVSASGNDTNTTLCSEKHPSYKAAGDNFIITRFETVLSVIKNHTVNMTSLERASDNYFDKAKQCTLKPLNNTHDVYLKLIKHSLENITLIDELNKDGGFKCIKNQTDAIIKCHGKANKTSTNDTHTIYQEIFSKSSLNFNKYNCDRTDDHKNCILNVLKKECNQTSVDFVKDLYDFVKLNNCRADTNTTDKAQTKGSSRTTPYWAGFVVLIVEWAKLHTM